MYHLKAYTRRLNCIPIVILFTALAGILYGNKTSSGGQSKGQITFQIDFCAIPAGSFIMGADLDPKFIVAGKDNGWRSIFIQDEFPQRSIKLTHPFEISKYEITNARYEQFDPSHKSWRGKFRNISDGDNEAVVYVSWEEASAYASWLSAKDKQFDYRLPTEAEWEYAARAGTRTPFNDGKSGDIYNLNPFDSARMKRMNYQGPYPFTFTNGVRQWVTWLPGKCTGVEDVYPDAGHIKDADLKVGQSGPNGFGICDMHGGVEEWVQDWYGPYLPGDTLNPAGYRTGDFKVTRGGSHNNHIQHARSANRMSAAINDKNYFLGFRLVRIPKQQKEGGKRAEQPVYPWGSKVSAGNYSWKKENTQPVFSINSLYELVPAVKDGSHYGSVRQMAQFGFDAGKKLPLLTGPLYTHNHSPAISWCENGDLIVSWFSGESEIGPELTLLASRGKRQPDGSLEWTPPSRFLKAEDRNMHSSNILNNAIRVGLKRDKAFTLHQMASIGIAGRWDKLALGYRKSTDNGATWSPVRMILDPDHGPSGGASMQGNMFQASDGMLVFVTDDKGDSYAGTGSLVVSTDNGQKWERRGYSGVTPDSLRIAGGHAVVAEINDVNKDGKKDLLAIARDGGAYYAGKAPQSISLDGGNTWKRSPSVFPSVGTGQRMTLLRLSYSAVPAGTTGSKPLLFTGFAGDSIRAKDGEGKLSYVTGLFAALSFDEGKTWPEEYRKVISNFRGKDSLALAIAPWQRTTLLTRTKGQHEGYFSSEQTPDGTIYLTDGKIVYTFNLAWLME
jgi:formylglycine-generating enzyme required for sulfatase activity